MEIIIIMMSLKVSNAKSVVDTKGIETPLHLQLKLKKLQVGYIKTLLWDKITCRKASIKVFLKLLKWYKDLYIECVSNGGLHFCTFVHLCCMSPKANMYQYYCTYIWGFLFLYQSISSHTFFKLIRTACSHYTWRVCKQQLSPSRICTVLGEGWDYNKMKETLKYSKTP